MNCLAAICLLGLAASAQATGLGLGLESPVYAPGYASSDYYSYPKYAFDYAVKDPHTGDNKAQWEKRDGDVVKGAYSLVEPDGSLRVVEYYADDKSGFNAVVKRIGPSIHPSGHGTAPIYKAPIPTLPHEPIGIAPYSIGPVANLGRLAHAPLITGPYGGHGAISTSSLIKESIPIIKAPIAPIITEPIRGALLEPYRSPLLLPLGGYKQPLLTGAYGGYNKIPLAPLEYSKLPLSPLEYNRVPLAPLEYLGNGLLTRVPYESSWRGGYGKHSYYD